MVLLSGGMDSATLLWLARKEFSRVWTISFNYGQRHRVELKYAEELACLANVEDHIVVDMPLYRSLKGSPLIDESSEVPEGEYPSEEPPPTTVPMRNLNFIATAGAFADYLEIDHIGIGVHSLDTPYPDCRPEFVSAAEAALNAGSVMVTKRKLRIHLWTPFIGKTKREIALLGKELGVPFEKTYSCYKGTEPPCGKCPTCIQREEALKSIL